MPTNWLDELYASAKEGAKAQDDLEELKQWIQDTSYELDTFMERYGSYDGLDLDIADFVRELQKKLEKKKNEVMGYE